jgi:SAM-dependent methyltransferase
MKDLRQLIPMITSDTLRSVARPIRKAGGSRAIARHTWRIAQRARRGLNHAEHWVFDWRLGVSTRGIVYTADSLTRTGGNGLYYENCGWLPVRRALRDLAPGPGDVFVDLGSGKGQALLVAGQLPFRRVIGVEIDEDFSMCAKRNVERARHRLKTQEVHTVTANVLDWPIPDDASVVFMCNPFVGQTFQTVIDRIFESYDRHPRSLYLVYAVPWEHNWLMSTGRVVVDNVRPWKWPTHPVWWRRGLVIISYRVTGNPEDAGFPPRVSGRKFGRRRAFRSWSKPNDFRFRVTEPGWNTVCSHS